MTIKGAQVYRIDGSAGGAVYGHVVRSGAAPVGVNGMPNRKIRIAANASQIFRLKSCVCLATSLASASSSPENITQSTQKNIGGNRVQIPIKTAPMVFESEIKLGRKWKYEPKPISSEMTATIMPRTMNTLLYFFLSMVTPFRFAVPRSCQ
jgi:hypothetical protein